MPPEHEVTENKRKTVQDQLSFGLTKTDLAYIYRGASVIIKEGAITQKKDHKLRNIYDSKSDQEFSTALLDRDSKEIGVYLLKRCLAKQSLFGSSDRKMPDISQFQGSAPLLHKAASSKGTTIKRTSVKLEKKQKSEDHIQNEKRLKKSARDVKEVERMNSKMNACQALVTKDCEKPTVSKADQIKKAFKKRFRGLVHS
jgi:hypothetical protein